MDTPSFPVLAKLRVQLPIQSYQYTVYPGPPETCWDFVVGFPLELHPFAWDYLHVGSGAHEVTLQPHYRESTWDTFHVSVDGHVRCTALGGLFPWTLGRQPELLEGLQTTIGALPAKVEPTNPDAAKTLAEIAAILAAIEAQLGSIPPEHLHAERKAAQDALRQTARGRAAEKFWERKHRRARERPERFE